MQVQLRKVACLCTLALLLALLFALSPLVTRSASAAAPATGKVIVVSLSKQWLYAYAQGTLVFNTPVTTGQPSLPTPAGTYTVFAKYSPTTFSSPWPKGSPNWYPPVHINYALAFLGGGYFIHDALWRSKFGPGTNVPHDDPGHGHDTGTHGCVNLPLSAASWLYNWTPIGTLVQINS